MRKFILSLSCLCIVFSSFAISKPVEPPPLKASQVFLPIGQHGEKISLMDLSTIGVRDFEKITGKKMGLFNRMGFKLSQKKLRASIGKDGSLDNKKLKKAFKSDGTTGFHLGGFVLGFLLGLIGILIAYLIKDEKKRNRVKWAWIGWVAWLLLWILVVI